MNKEELEKVIEEHNIAYSAGIPFITDAEYDVLWQALHAIDPDHPLLYHTAQSYNQVHGKTWHKHQIFGTNKAFNMEDLKPFLMSNSLAAFPSTSPPNLLSNPTKQPWFCASSREVAIGFSIRIFTPAFKQSIATW